jgi:hypothetical protein
MSNKQVKAFPRGVAINYGGGIAPSPGTAKESVERQVG